MEIFIQICSILSIIIPLLVAVAYLTTIERKIMGYIQRREGPNDVGFSGLLQPFSDGLKLFAKETTSPTNADTAVFFMAPSITFILSLIGWAVIPFSNATVFCDLNLGVLYVFAISALNVFGILFAGWSSNSKYAYLGALRSAAQMVSYEISIGLTVLSVVICSRSFNLTTIVTVQKEIWLIIPLLPIFLIFSLSILSETNRHPFDLPEAEAELVSGYNVEYSSMSFALFFLGEYSNILFMSMLLSIMFLGSWMTFPLCPTVLQSFWVSIKTIFGAIFFIFARAGLPRYRFDQLMTIGWRVLFPLSLGYFIVVSGILLGLNFCQINLL